MKGGQPRKSRLQIILRRENDTTMKNRKLQLKINPDVLCAVHHHLTKCPPVTSPLYSLVPTSRLHPHFCFPPLFLLHFTYLPPLSTPHLHSVDVSEFNSHKPGPHSTLMQSHDKLFCLSLISNLLLLFPSQNEPLPLQPFHLHRRKQSTSSPCSL